MKEKRRVDYATLCDGRGLERVVKALNGYSFKKHVNLKKIMPEILLTGANGFLGKEVVRLLNEHDYNFAGVGRNISTSSKLSCDLSIWKM